MSDEKQSAERSSFEAFHHYAKLLSAAMGLESDFLNDLRDEDDDWSLVIKLHAVVEAAVNELLKAKLAEPGLASMLSDRFPLHTRIDVLATIEPTNSDARKATEPLSPRRASDTIRACFVGRYRG